MWVEIGSLIPRQEDDIIYEIEHVALCERFRLMAFEVGMFPADDTPTMEKQAIVAVGTNIVDQGTHLGVANNIGLDLDHQVGPVFPDGAAGAPPQYVPHPRRQFSGTLVGKVKGI